MTPIEMLTTASCIVAGASVVLKALEILTRYTKTKKDDRIVSKLATALNAIKKILQVVAINPKKEAQK